METGGRRKNAAGLARLAPDYAQEAAPNFSATRAGRGGAGFWPRSMS